MKLLQLPRYDFDDTPTDVRVTLAALLRPATVVDVTTPLDEVRRLLLEAVPAIAVVEDERLRGVITRTDVLRITEGTAVDAMSSFVFALPIHATVEKAAALLAYEGVGQIVVTGERGTLLGMVSAVDIARHYAIESGYLVG